MRKLGNIRIAVICDKYQINFNYANLQKIDFFALTLMEIIRRQKQFENKTLAEVLVLLDIPHDLHNIFENRLSELINNKPEMIERAKWSSYNYLKNKIISLLDYNAADYALSKLGEETYLTKEIIEKTKSFSNVFIYEHNSNLLTQIENIQNENDAIVIDSRNNESNIELVERFSSIIGNQIGKYILGANNKTKIFDFQIFPTKIILIRDNIEINIEDSKLCFTHKSERIIDEFRQLPTEIKKGIRAKMFLYLDVPHNKLNIDKAKIAAKPSYPLKMKVIYGNENVINQQIFKKNLVEEDEKIQVHDINLVDNFTFAGITQDDKTIIYKYTELIENGYTIPFEESDYAEDSYSKLYYDIWEQFVNKITTVETINLILSITPKAKLKEAIIKIAELNKKSNECVNVLIAFNENATNEALELYKLYNDLLEKEKIKTIFHKSNLYALYAEYGNQLEKLKQSGFENYYSYSLPEDWDTFLNKVLMLKALFKKLDDKFTNTYRKAANDFFTRVEEDYYNLAPINQNIDNALIISNNWKKEINIALNTKKPNYIAISAVIRGKFEEALRKIEKQKDTSSNNSRKGRELIQFVFSDIDTINQVYRSWKNLCVLVHLASAIENTVTKGSDNDKKELLKKAMRCYEQFLEEKKLTTR